MFHTSLKYLIFLLAFVINIQIGFGYDLCKHIPDEETNEQLQAVIRQVEWQTPKHLIVDYLDNYIISHPELTESQIFHLRIELGVQLGNENLIDFYNYSKKFINENNFEICIHFEALLSSYIYEVLKYENSNDLSSIVELLEKKHNTLSEEIIQKYLAGVYFKQGDFTMAITHWRLTIDRYPDNSIKHIQKKSSLYNNIGVSYKRLGKLKEARIAFNKAIKKWNGIKHTDKFSKNYQKYFSMVLEDNLLQLEESTLAIKKKRFNHYKKMYDFGRKNTLPVFDYPLFSNLAHLAFETKAYDEGFRYYECCDSIIKKNNQIDLNTLFSFYSLKIKYHSIKGEHQEVFKTLNKLDSVKIATFDRYKKILPKIESLDSKYTNNLLIKKQEAFEKEERTRNLLYWTIAILITLILYTLQINKKERKSRKQINIQKNIIEFSLKKSKILIREIHHRVKNNLQFVNSIVYLEYIKNKNKFDINSFERKIISLAQVHDMLYSSENISKVNIKEYVHKLVSEIKTASSNQFNYNLHISDIHLSLETTISFGLIINELITNTLKYCQPLFERKKEVEIQIYIESDTYILEYKDNGQSKQEQKEEFDITEISLISLLVDRLKGELTMVELEGYHVKIQFKDNE